MFFINLLKGRSSSKSEIKINVPSLLSSMITSDMWYAKAVADLRVGLAGQGPPKNFS